MIRIARPEKGGTNQSKVRPTLVQKAGRAFDGKPDLVFFRRKSIAAVWWQKTLKVTVLLNLSRRRH